MTDVAFFNNDPEREVRLYSTKPTAIYYNTLGAGSSSSTITIGTQGLYELMIVNLNTARAEINLLDPGSTLIWAVFGCSASSVLTRRIRTTEANLQLKIKNDNAGSADIALFAVGT